MGEVFFMYFRPKMKVTTHVTLLKVTTDVTIFSVTFEFPCNIMRLQKVTGGVTKP